jgi:hypothetical protein
MARPRTKSSKGRKHKTAPVYDGTLKALFGSDAAEILPILLPGTELLHDQNIELDRSQLRADLVYNILYDRLPHILNMELQTDEDTKMHLRLLQYHTNLHVKYELPVLSVVLYPFELNIPEPPYQELSGDRVLLNWEYGVIALYRQEAELYRRKQAFCMYSLLPAMKGVNAEMLIQTLQEMKQYYPTEAMKHHLDRFWKMLQKSITISPEDKERVEEELRMQFDWFIDTVPEVIERVQQAEKRGEAKGEAKGEARGEAKGKVAGELQALRQMVLDVVQVHFPSLLLFAQTQVNVITQPVQLRKLALDLMQAQDEATAIRLLTARE